MRRLHPPLIAIGIGEADLHLWTSHCFRRGSSIDVRCARGVRAMLSHGQWGSAQAAEPYASADELFAVSIAAAQRAIDLSDDDT